MTRDCRDHAKLDAKDARGLTPLMVANGGLQVLQSSKPWTATLLRELLVARGLPVEDVLSGPKPEEDK